MPVLHNGGRANAVKAVSSERAMIAQIHDGGYD